MRKKWIRDNLAPSSGVLTMIIHSYESSPRSDACVRYLRESDVAKCVEKIILLPIPTTKDNRTVSKTNIYINEVLDGISAENVICGYGLPDEFTDNARQMGARVFDLGRDEDFLSYNAQLTALCALGIILGSTAVSIGDMTVGVVGYGRIGKRLTNILLYLGASVRVFTSRESVRLELCEWGVATALSAVGADLSGLDILINTAPARIFEPSAIPKNLRVIELASGDNFQGLDRVEKYPSIPAKMFPASAGIAWGKAVERFIADNK